MHPRHTGCINGRDWCRIQTTFSNIFEIKLLNFRKTIQSQCMSVFHDKFKVLLKIISSSSDTVNVYLCVISMINTKIFSECLHLQLCKYVNNVKMSNAVKIN